MFIREGIDLLYWICDHFKWIRSSTDENKMGAFKGFHIWITWIMVIKKHYYIAWQWTKSKKWYLYGCLSYHSPSRSPAHHQRSPEEQHGMTPPISEGRQCTPQVARSITGELRSISALNDQELSRRGYHGLTSPSSASSTTSWTGKCTWTVGPCNTSIAWLQFFFFWFFSFSSWTKFFLFCTQYLIFAFPTTR